ncbi:MAG: ABC transporter ATP-binding protein [Desulfomonile tiedjei]|nr:ABC transporter ATP-binding protein [Desulfomonile tiedjei]
MPLLEVNGLFKDFSGLKVLFGIDLKLEQGDRHAIIGPNGAGKSTLFNVITGKYAPSRGKITFKGHDISGLPPHKIARLGLARSFQVTNIFRAMTVFENVRNAVLSQNGKRYSIFPTLAKMRAITEKTEQILDLIGLLDRKDELAGELAHGHQRALEIGMTIAMDPVLILLDEPTAGMSSKESRETVGLIEKVTEGKTLLIVEHDMDVVFSIANGITVIYYGQVLASGSPETIRNDQKVKDAYLGEERE